MVESSVFIFDTIGFFGPENASFAVKITFLGRLEAEILTKTFYGSHFVKIKSGDHIGLGANGNIQIKSNL